LNPVIAVPTIGFLFEPNFGSAAETLAALRSQFEQWHAQGQTLTVTQPHPLSLAVQASSGFTYTIEPHQLVVAFGYRAALNSTGKEIAAVTYSPQPAQFTVLAQRLLETSAEVLARLPAPRRLQRIGIVATGRVPRESPPPGLLRLIQHIGAPWGAAPAGCVARITSVLSQDLDVTEKCHHGFQYEEGPNDGVVQFTLDWQKYYSNAPSLGARELSKRATGCLETALAYFEKFGSGDLQYDD